MDTRSRCSLTLATATIVASCGPPANRIPSAAADLAAPHPVACDPSAATRERLVFDWSLLDRAKLESAARDGVVLLRVNGCRSEIAEGCTTAGRYRYAPTSRQREMMRLRDTGEVGARLPIGAARIGASRGRSSALDVTMTVIGRYEAERRSVAASELEGTCGGVTHFVTSLSVGSFEVVTAADAEISAEADIALAAAHGRSTAERRHLDSAGVASRCSAASGTDTEPPHDCGVPLRIELRPIGEGPVPRTSPPPTGELHGVSALVRGEVAPCYRSELSRHPNLAGGLTVAITVDREGRVLSTSAQHDVHEELARCAVSRISRLTLPSATTEGPRTFVVPFVFHGVRSGAPR